MDVKNIIGYYFVVKQENNFLSISYFRRLYFLLLTTLIYLFSFNNKLQILRSVSF